MRVTLLLADSAQAIDNKLYLLGGGWSICGPQPTPMAIAMKIEVPWDQTNKRHHWQLGLLDADGEPVLLPTPEGQRPLQMGGEFEVGRPPGIAPGTPIDLALAVNMGPIPIPPGGRYVWQLSINDRTQDEWQLSFSARTSQTPEGG